MRLPDKKKVTDIIKRALKEDIGKGDITTTLSVPDQARINASIIAKEAGVLCGLGVVKEVFSLIDRRIRVKTRKEDGAAFSKNEKIIHIKGPARSILTGERVAINFLSFLSGISTYTRKFTDKTKGTQAMIMDTRKTSPTLRILEKYAVRTGGARNHRSDLGVGIIIKDNHLRASGVIHKKGIDDSVLARIIAQARIRSRLPVEVEVETLAEFKKALVCKPDTVMLDNFSLAALKKAVSYRNAKFPGIKLEASGGINLTNVKAIARCGVDFISVGMITHSSRSIDFSLEVNL